LRLIGAAVLVGWALWSLRESFRPPPPPTDGPPWRGRAYLVGFLSTATNPKVGLFLLAFLPQFVPAGYPVASTMATLAAVYLGIATVWMCVLVELIYRLRQRVLTPAVVVTLRRITALIFLALAARFLVAA
jgi:threonine/homoserine/homoserine lactone efflux protein